LSADVSEREQCLDAILSNGELKNFAEDFRGSNRLDPVADATIIHVSGWYNRSDRAAYLSVVSVAGMVGGERGPGGIPTTRRRDLSWFRKSRGPCVLIDGLLWKSRFRACSRHPQGFPPQASPDSTVTRRGSPEVLVHPTNPTKMRTCSSSRCVALRIPSRILRTPAVRGEEFSPRVIGPEGIKEFFSWQNGGWIWTSSDCCGNRVDQADHF